MDSVDQRSGCTLCVVGSWSTLSAKASCVFISKETVKAFTDSNPYIHGSSIDHL